MPNKDSRTATAEKIAALIRIFRAASISKDASLRVSAATELAKYGIRVADLATSRVSEVPDAG